MRTLKSKNSRYKRSNHYPQGWKREQDRIPHPMPGPDPGIAGKVTATVHWMVETWLWYCTSRTYWKSILENIKGNHPWWLWNHPETAEVGTVAAGTAGNRSPLLQECMVAAGAGAHGLRRGSYGLVQAADHCALQEPRKLWALQNHQRSSLPLSMGLCQHPQLTNLTLCQLEKEKHLKGSPQLFQSSQWKVNMEVRGNKLMSGTLS